MHFSKYHALGNDYIVVNPENIQRKLTPPLIRKLCHRHYGIGSDGLLMGPLESSECHFGLRLFNPDGSEFEKSGNGLHIFARYLWDRGLVEDKPVSILTLGGKVIAQVQPGGSNVILDLGQISFHSHRIPVSGPPREVIKEKMEIQGRTFRFCAATIGNPHCVLIQDEISAEETLKWGPLIEKEERFPHRTNVQFVQILDRNRIRIEIWERSAGYTLASGTSSSAAAATAYRLGLCDSLIKVEMPGGRIEVTIAKDWTVTIKGDVQKICEGDVAERDLIPLPDEDI